MGAASGGGHGDQRPRTLLGDGDPAVAPAGTVKKDFVQGEDLVYKRAAKAEGLPLVVAAMVCVEVRTSRGDSKIFLYIDT